MLLDVSSGSGGDGCLSFCSTRTKPRSGPDGGDGGAGGAFLFQSSSRYKDFEHLKKSFRFTADSGKSGQSQLKKGSKGQDLILPIPIGTLIKNQKDQILKDFPKAKTDVFLEPGRGGRGNAFFKTSLNQAPRQFQKGEKAVSQKVILELKPCVQVAIIGKVNAGKSSFFNLVTKAKSKVASYPYTTLSPYIGQLKHLNTSCFIMDIPGLQKGASYHVHQGLSFLRSIQRASLLLHFIDSQSQDPFADQQEIINELKAFDEKYSNTYFKKLSQIKRFYVFTKEDQKHNISDLKNHIKSKYTKAEQKDFFFISNTEQRGVSKCLQAIDKYLLNTK